MNRTSPNTYHGFVGGANRDEVWGWVYRAQGDQPVKVNILVDEEVVLTGMADIVNAWIRDANLHSTGEVGFRFKLRKNGIRLPKQCAIRVVTEDGSYELEQSPWPFKDPRKVKLPSGKRGPDQFIYIHVPKTAGTSFSNMLLRQFDQSLIFATDEDKKLESRTLGVNDYLNLSPARLEGLKVLVGHIPYAAGRIMPGTTHFLTFLRHPVLRAVSHLLYTYNTTTDQKLPLEDYFHQIKHSQLDNLMTRCFADSNPWDLKCFRGHSNVDSAALHSAMQNLARCAFVGIAELFDESAAIAKHLFGWNLGKSRYDNVRGWKMSKSVPESIIDEITSINQYDMMLYEHGLNHLRELAKHYHRDVGAMPSLEEE